jgi:hypothetical protein
MRSKIGHSLLGVLAAGLLSLGAARPGLAQEPPPKEDRCSETGKAKKPRTKKVGKVVVIVDELVICGKVPKPLALVFIAGSQINYEWETTKPDFLKRVHDSLGESQF